MYKGKTLLETDLNMHRVRYACK